MSNQIYTTVQDATDTLKGVSTLQPGSGDIKGICLNGSSLRSDMQAQEPICIGADEKGLINFEAGQNVALEAIKNGLRISSTGGGAAGFNTIIIRDESTVSRIAQDKTIYIINNINPIKSSFWLPETAKVGFVFIVIGIRGGFTIGRNPNVTQYLKFKDRETDELISGQNYSDAIITCYEENVRFKWLLFSE